MQRALIPLFYFASTCGGDCSGFHDSGSHVPCPPGCDDWEETFMNSNDCALMKNGL
jgi:hypothetical protein